ncbi:MAG: helix-turn-helix domain-containing protein [Propionibacteriaceae bacterium]|jgi:predicted nucleotidyltransferase|nr:helix-turn-helix domain-containing protein [Propionibacteriaceae bacterium]
MPSVLTPFVRSDAVGAILAEVFADPQQELTFAEVARRAEVLPAVAHRELGRLVDSGVLTDRREGNNRLVRVNPDHPLYRAMSEVIAMTYGPVPVLRDLLNGLSGVKEAFIYGSWAARRLGETGPPPRDIDVLVVGSLDVDTLVELQDLAREKLRIDVNIHRATVSAWESPDGNPFLINVASRPLVRLIPPEVAGA